MLPGRVPAVLCVAPVSAYAQPGRRAYVLHLRYWAAARIGKKAFRTLTYHSLLVLQTSARSLSRTLKLEAVARWMVTTEQRALCLPKC